MFASPQAREALQRVSPRTLPLLETFVASQCYYERNGTGVWLDVVKRNVSNRFSLRQMGRNRRYVYFTPHEVVDAVPAVVDKLLADDVLEVVYEAPRTIDAIPPEELAADTLQPAGKPVALRYRKPAGGTNKEAAAAFRTKWAARVGRDLEPHQQARLADLFGRCRQAGRAVHTGNGTLALHTPRRRQARFAVAAPSQLMLAAQGVTIWDMTLFVLWEDGTVHGYQVPWDRITADFLDDDIFVTIDVRRLRPAPGLATRSSLVPYARLDIPDECHHAISWEGLEGWLGFAPDARLRKAITATFGRRRRKNKALASALLRPLLDPAVVHLAARMPSRSVSAADYNFFVAPDPQRALYRRQAVEAYPLMASLMRRSDQLRDLVDAGRPINEALSEITGVRPAVLRRVGRLHWQRTGTLVAEQLGDPERPLVGRLLDACPPDRLPDGRRAWDGFRRLVKFVDGASRQGIDFNARACAALVPSVSRDWRGFQTEWGPIGDMIQDVAIQIANALIAHPRFDGDFRSRRLVERVVRTVSHLIVGDTPSLTALNEASRRWHERMTELHRRLADISSRGGAVAHLPIGWLPLDEPFEAPGGGRIDWLTTREQLAAETEVLQHCVGSYGHRCLFQGSHIGAVTGPGGGRSTVELRPQLATEDGSPRWKLSIVQHHAYRNKPAPVDCKAVVSAFLELRQDLIDYQTIEAERCERDRCRSLIESINVRFAHNDPEQCAAVIELYRPFLRRETRHLDREGLAVLVAERAGPPPQHEDLDFDELWDIDWIQPAPQVLVLDPPEAQEDALAA